MTDFETACNSTFRLELAGREPSTELASALTDRMARFDDLQKEVQTHDRTFEFCRLVMAVGHQHGLEIDAMLAVAFSHGVMIGCVMNAQELPEDLLR